MWSLPNFLHRRRSSAPVPAEVAAAEAGAVAAEAAVEQGSLRSPAPLIHRDRSVPGEVAVAAEAVVAASRNLAAR